MNTIKIFEDLRCPKEKVRVMINGIHSGYFVPCYWCNSYVLLYKNNRLIDVLSYKNTKFKVNRVKNIEIVSDYSIELDGNTLKFDSELDYIDKIEYVVNFGSEDFSDRYLNYIRVEYNNQNVVSKENFEMEKDSLLLLQIKKNKKEWILKEKPFKPISFFEYIEEKGLRTRTVYEKTRFTEFEYITTKETSIDMNLKPVNFFILKNFRRKIMFKAGLK